MTMEGMITSDKSVERTRSLFSWVIVEAFAAACFWASLTLGFFGQGYSSSIVYDTLVPMVLIPTGSVVVLLVLGLAGPRVMGKKIFILGVVLVSVHLVAKGILVFTPNVVLLNFTTALSSGICALFVLGWCDRVSRTDTCHAMALILSSSLMAVVLILFSLQMGYVGSSWFAVILQLVSGLLGIAIARETPIDSAIQPEKMSVPMLAILFVFGALSSILSMVSKDFLGDVGPVTSVFVVAWTIFALVVTGGTVYYLHRHSYVNRFLVVLLPIGVLCLLTPPFVVRGSERIIQALLACIIICEAIIYSISPSNALVIFRLGRIHFTFWQRAWGILGIDIGFIVGGLFYMLHPKPFPFDNAFWLFFVGAILFLTLAMLLGRMGFGLTGEGACELGSLSSEASETANNSCSTCKLQEEKSIQNSVDRVCRSLGEEYSLTARELEILQLLATGRSLPYIQEQLVIAPSTAATHVNHIYKKLGIHSKQELLTMVYQGEEAV